jgi:hypothetical protein
MINNEELIENTDYLAVYARCRTNRGRYNRVYLRFVTVKELIIIKWRGGFSILKEYQILEY